MSGGAVAVSLPAWGASVDAAMSAPRPCCHAGAGGALAGAAVDTWGEAGGVVWAHPDKTLSARKALKVTLFFYHLKVSVCWVGCQFVAVTPCMLTGVVVSFERVFTHGTASAV